MNEVETKDVGTTDLSAYMMKVIEELRREGSAAPLFLHLPAS